MSSLTTLRLISTTFQAKWVARLSPRIRELHLDTMVSNMEVGGQGVLYNVEADYDEETDDAVHEGLRDLVSKTLSSLKNLEKLVMPYANADGLWCLEPMNWSSKSLRTVYADECDLETLSFLCQADMPLREVEIDTLKLVGDKNNLKYVSDTANRINASAIKVSIQLVHCMEDLRGQFRVEGDPKTPCPISVLLDDLQPLWSSSHLSTDNIIFLSLDLADVETGDNLSCLAHTFPRVQKLTFGAHTSMALMESACLFKVLSVFNQLDYLNFMFDIARLGIVNESPTQEGDLYYYVSEPSLFSEKTSTILRQLLPACVLRAAGPPAPHLRMYVSLMESGQEKMQRDRLVHFRGLPHETSFFQMETGWQEIQLSHSAVFLNTVCLTTIYYG